MPLETRQRDMFGCELLLSLGERIVTSNEPDSHGEHARQPFYAQPGIRERAARRIGKEGSWSSGLASECVIVCCLSTWVLVFSLWEPGSGECSAQLAGLCSFSADFYAPRLPQQVKGSDLGGLEKSEDVEETLQDGDVIGGGVMKLIFVHPRAGQWRHVDALA